MPATSYTYTIATDIPAGVVSVARLRREIELSAIITQIDYNAGGISAFSNGTLVIWFKDTLPSGEKEDLDGSTSQTPNSPATAGSILGDHTGEALPDDPQLVEVTSGTITIDGPVDGDGKIRSPDGTVFLGDTTNPLRTDPTGTTTQPVSAASLPLPTGAATQTTLAAVETNTDNLDVLLSTRATEATLASVETNTDNLDVLLSTRATEATLGAVETNTDNLDVLLSTRAAEHTAADDPHAVRLTDGASFYRPTTPADTQPVYLRDEQHGGIPVPFSAFGMPKVVSESVLEDLRFDTEALFTKWDITTTLGAGYEPAPGGVGARFATSTQAGSKVEFVSKIKGHYEAGKALIMKISIVLGDTGVAGNIREWGLKNAAGDGLFFRMDGTALKFVHKNQGVETEILASAFDVPVTPDANGHLFYIQYPWLGVADIYIYYDNQIVHHLPLLGQSTEFTLGDPDMNVFILNHNVSATQSVSLKSGCASLAVEGDGPVLGRNHHNGQSLPITVDGLGSVHVVPVNALGDHVSTEDAPGTVNLSVHDDDVLATLQLMLKELRMLRLMLGHATELGLDDD